MENSKKYNLYYQKLIIASGSTKEVDAILAKAKTELSDQEFQELKEEENSFKKHSVLVNARRKEMKECGFAEIIQIKKIEKLGYIITNPSDYSEEVLRKIATTLTKPWGEFAYQKMIVEKVTLSDFEKMEDNIIFHTSKIRDIVGKDIVVDSINFVNTTASIDNSKRIRLPFKILKDTPYLSQWLECDKFKLQLSRDKIVVTRSDE